MNAIEPETTNNHHRFFLTSALIAAPLLIALVALGCGEEKEKAAANLATKESAAPVGASAPETRAGVVAQPAAAVQPAEVAATEGTLPPDIVAAGPESIVLPGSVVTVAATGSTDVTSVVLTDRAGQKTPFTYDSESNLWKASYRVPIRTAGEKLALAVTASTEANRWKRVWVFLRLRDAAVPTEAAPDSAQ